MSQTLQSVRGMNDILPDEAEFWELFEDTVRSWLKGLRLPADPHAIVEPTPLFKRAIGEVTDIVERKCIPSIDSLNGEPRPCARKARPVASAPSSSTTSPPSIPAACTTSARCSATSGRRRAATASSIGSASRPSGLPGPDIDAEMILMGARLWPTSAGRHRTADQQPRPAGRAGPAPCGADRLFRGARRTARRDAKTPPCIPIRCASSIPKSGLQDLCAAAPKLIDYLGESSLAIFERRAAGSAMPAFPNQPLVWCAVSTTI